MIFPRSGDADFTYHYVGSKAPPNKAWNLFRNRLLSSKAHAYPRLVVDDRRECQDTYLAALVPEPKQVRAGRLSVNLI